MMSNMMFTIQDETKNEIKEDLIKYVDERLRILKELTNSEFISEKISSSGINELSMLKDKIERI